MQLVFADMMVGGPGTMNAVIKASIPSILPHFNWLIHGTAQLETLGKADSNGCIGTSESDAWVMKYHLPRGTKIKNR